MDASILEIVGGGDATEAGVCDDGVGGFGAARPDGGDAGGAYFLHLRVSEADDVAGDVG